MVSGDAPTIFFLGNRSEIEQLKEQYPVMAGKVPAENMVEIEPLTADEIMYGIQQELESRELTLSEEAAETIESGLRKRAEAGLLGNKTSDYCVRFVEESLMEGFRKRMITSCFTANGDIHHALLRHQLDTHRMWQQQYCRQPGGYKRNGGTEEREDYHQEHRHESDVRQQ